jgi:hypothetical protein
MPNRLLPPFRPSKCFRKFVADFGNSCSGKTSFVFCGPAPAPELKSSFHAESYKRSRRLHYAKFRRRNGWAHDCVRFPWVLNAQKRLHARNTSAHFALSRLKCRRKSSTSLLCFGSGLALQVRRWARAKCESYLSLRSLLQVRSPTYICVDKLR